jgi:hypothetical protein
MKIKIHKSYRDVVAICDSNLLGKKFEEGEKQLDVREDFYNGEEVDGEELLEKIKTLSKHDATFNIVGEDSINLALKAKIIRKEGIKKVEKIPFALVLL